MIDDGENAFAALPRHQVNHEIGQPLDTLSVSEIEERILLLKAEIARLEESMGLKQASRAAAAAFFKL